MNLGTLDQSIIFAYFAFVFGLAWYVSRGGRKGESEDYFLAGRNLPWFLIGASLFASNIGSEHLVGLASAGARGGLAVGHFEILASLILLLLGWVFVPFYINSGVTTMPEFLDIRYGRSARTYLSVISVIAYVLTKIAVTIFAGAKIFEAVGVDFWMGAGVVVVVTGIYTVIGGLRAVIYTDMIQMFIMLFGSLAVTGISIFKLGGVTEVVATVPDGFFNMWKSINHPDFPWTGIIFGAPILAVWYWCTDQYVVQRVLSAKNITQARRGSIFAGFLKILPLFLFVLPGILATAMASKGLLDLEDPNHALPAIITGVMPIGLKGVVLAGLLAALMSSLSSVFNSCSTLVTYDFYKQWRPKASEKELIIFGQSSTAILVLIGIAWIPFMEYISSDLYNYLQSVQAYISPPIAAVFLLGLFFKRLNQTGAMASLLSGFVLGMGRIPLEINKAKLSGFLHWYADLNFLHFAIFLFIICSTILVVVSLMTAPSTKDLSKVTYDRTKKINFSPAVKKDIALSFGLVAAVGAVWICFSGIFF